MIRLLIGVLARCTGGAGAQDFPNRPVRIVVPYPLAGSVDFLLGRMQVKLP